MQFKIGEKPGLYRVIYYSVHTYFETDKCFTTQAAAIERAKEYSAGIVLDPTGVVVYIHPEPAPRMVQPELPQPPETVRATGKWQEWYCASDLDLEWSDNGPQYDTAMEAYLGVRPSPDTAYAIYDPHGCLYRVIPPAVRWESADEEGVT